jgi:peptidyl-prolyl cis-trans isomerase SurA
MNETLSSRTLLAIALASMSVCAAAQGLRLPPGAGSGLSAPAAAPTPATPPMAAPAALPSSPGSNRSSDGIAAIVGNQVITDYDLQLRLQAVRQQAQAAGAELPPAAQLRAQVLDQMIDEMALAQYAEQTGLGVSDDTLERAIAQVARNNKLTVAELRRAVEREGMSWNAYRDQLRREILISRLRERTMAQLPPITASQIDDYLARQNAAADSQTQYDIAQIFLPVPQNATAEQVAAVKDKMDAIAAQLKAGADFAALAKKYSQGEGAKEGGDLGMRPADRLPTLFVDTVRDLAPGQISPVIRSAAGFHILKLLRVSGQTGAASTAMQSKVREIVLRASTEAERARARAELDAIAQAVQSGKVQFSEKARELSQDEATASRGGDLGWVLPGQLDPALDAALQQLNPGEVSAPVVVGNKVVLLQLVDRAMRPLTEAQKRALAKEMLQREKAAQDFDELVRDVRARTYVRIPEND